MLGDQIRELRREQALTVRDLAEMVGVHPSHISRVERGKVNPTTALVERIDQAMGCSLAALVRIDDPTVQDLTRFLLDASVSEAKKHGVRRMVHVLVRME